MESGWYRITSSETLSPYEWNSVSLHYGVLGFSVSINGRVSASCDVSQGRSSNNLYFGDFPDDTIYESMSGYIQNLKWILIKLRMEQVGTMFLAIKFFLISQITIGCGYFSVPQI